MTYRKRLADKRPRQKVGLRIHPDIWHRATVLRLNKSAVAERALRLRVEEAVRERYRHYGRVMERFGPMTIYGKEARRWWNMLMSWGYEPPACALIDYSSGDCSCPECSRQRKTQDAAGPPGGSDLKNLESEPRTDRKEAGSSDLNNLENEQGKGAKYSE